MSRAHSLSRRIHRVDIGIAEIILYLLAAAYVIYGVVQFYTTDPLQRSDFGWIAVIFASIMLGILGGLVIVAVLNYLIAAIERTGRR